MHKRTTAVFTTLLAFGSTVAQQYLPGEVYFSADGHIEYRCGELPLVIAAPHGGYLMPNDMPDRTCNDAAWTTDAFTLELALAIDTAFTERFGCRPHLVINHLHRRKFDANRNLASAACGDPQAEAAWYAFHDFIDAVKAQVDTSFGKGFFLDLHGHGHAIQRLELGYLLYEDELALSDDVLNTTQYINWSSLRNLTFGNELGLSHSALLRGPLALGTMLGDRGYPAVPSAQDPYPLSGQPYFSGGYNTAQHSSYLGGTVDGVQMECNMNGVRDTPLNRRRFADSLSVALVSFLGTHYFGAESFAECLTTDIPNGNAPGPEATLGPALASDQLWLGLPKGPVEVLLVDVQGRILERTFHAAGRHGIRVEHLASGAYVLLVVHEGGRQALRFIKD